MNQVVHRQVMPRPLYDYKRVNIFQTSKIKTMKKTTIKSSLWLAALILAMASCKKNTDGNIPPENTSDATESMMLEDGKNPDELSLNDNSNLLLNRGDGHNTYLYTETNEAGVNSIVILAAKKNGQLQVKDRVAAGGKGLGVRLGSQGALAFSDNNEWLFAVNAGSNSISSYKVGNNGTLTLMNTSNTMGSIPVSLSVHNRLLYVLNRGTDNISGFTIGEHGKLNYIEGSTQALSGTAVDAPQVSITPDGNWVVVTEKATNIIGTFRIKNNGSIYPGTFSNAAAPTPFGFDFSRGYMIVSNAVGGAAGAGSASSHKVKNDGSVVSVNGAVANQQGAPCWVATTKYGRYAYVANTASNTVSSYYVSPFGRLYLIHAAAGNTDKGAADLVVTKDNGYVYVLTSGSHTINGFRRKPLGKLESTSTSEVLPASTTGLATR